MHGNNKVWLAPWSKYTNFLPLLYQRVLHSLPQWWSTWYITLLIQWAPPICLYINAFSTILSLDLSRSNSKSELKRCKTSELNCQGQYLMTLANSEWPIREPTSSNFKSIKPIIIWGTETILYFAKNVYCSKLGFDQSKQKIVLLECDCIYECAVADIVHRNVSLVLWTWLSKNVLYV